MPSSQKRVLSHTINDHALFMHGAFILHEAGILPKKDYTVYLNRFSGNVATLGDQVWWLEARSFCNTALVEAIYKKFAEETLPDELGLGLFALDLPEPAEAN
jgi:hypothetical protein